MEQLQKDAKLAGARITAASAGRIDWIKRGGAKALIAGVAAALAVAACQDISRQLPKTELPKLPESAQLYCPEATDAELEACIDQLRNNRTGGDLCRKLEISCTRYDDLKAFVQRTWSSRDGK